MKRKLLILMSALAVLGSLALYAAYTQTNRTPGELLRYAERRLEGHPKLELVFVPAIHWVRAQVERPVQGLEPPAYWRGARADSPSGRAASTFVLDTGATPANTRPAKMVSTPQGLVDAVGSAKPGDVIEIAPGRYRLSGRSISTRSGGLGKAPITVRGRRLGDVVLEFNMLEGFHVQHPNWIFENLDISGVCSNDDDCEHAFHVVGNAQSTVIRNNRMRDFNAHIKVNGFKPAFPDFGLIQANTLFNSRPRKTAHPVTPIDIVGANEWNVVDNFIADFVKLGGNQVSYGAFMKGAGAGGRFERNMIVCALNLPIQTGARVGLSFGGGGTDVQYCRDGSCAYEHDQGFAANNIVAHCNDFGIDVNRSRNVTLAHNTLINTAGIDIRNVPASAAISNNILEGRIRERGGGWFLGANNWEGSAHDLFAEPDRLEFKNARWPSDVPALPTVRQDICGEPRGSTTRPGAISGSGECLRRRVNDR